MSEQPQQLLAMCRCEHAAEDHVYWEAGGGESMDCIGGNDCQCDKYDPRAAQPVGTAKPEKDAE